MSAHHDRRTDGDVVVEALAVRYGRQEVLDGLDLTVQRGQTTVLLGPNGSGKSTLLRACLGVVRAESGRIRVLGLDPQRRPARVQRLVGYVPDKPDVYGWMTTEALFRFLRPHYPTWDPGRAEELVERLDVPRTQPFGRMSRGQGMKAMLAAALAPRPAVLLLDEPFGGLDPLVREEVLASVVGALGDGASGHAASGHAVVGHDGARDGVACDGVTRDGEARDGPWSVDVARDGVSGDDAPTVLLATHDLEIAARIADRVAVLANGGIRREGTVDEIGGRNVPTPAAKRLHATLAVAAEEV